VTRTLHSISMWARTLGATALGAGAASAGTASAAPTVSAPYLTGTARSGSILKVVGPAAWRTRGTTVSYAWLACDQLDCALITFGTRPSVVVPGGLDPARHWYVAVVATARNAHGSTTTTLFSDQVAA
jgi:hypothetical protein